MYNELHIFEERHHLFWGLLIFICTATGTYLLAGSFIYIDWNFFNLEQITALLLFLISFRGLFVISDPLYQFILYFDGRTLVIETKKGSNYIGTTKIPVDEIEALKFEPHVPRKSHEALFDFSPAYNLLYKKSGTPAYQKLIEVSTGDITLKVDDIADIMRFVIEKNPDISVPRQQADYFNL